jgi:chromate transporter
MKIFDLFIALIKVGVFGFGGGQSMIPLMQDVLVREYGFIGLEDFSELVAFSSVLPVPVGTKLAVSVGYSYSGYLCALVASLAIVLPSTLAILLLIHFFRRFNELPFIQPYQEQQVLLFLRFS